ncbi:hypothetical protein CDCA_CDCA12G3424 [Cyanidium caldarium]|uniref:Cation efflux protein transmembrane domain-containing protein n=1 Tax=Cyanidium caldarium TaxID=2771 RepID=A0AAV9IYN4_CYACA|nr:hypothetical protein CDCA_CDCA12G3424 [Cyanidium caldarium]
MRWLRAAVPLISAGARWVRLLAFQRLAPSSSDASLPALPQWKRTIATTPLLTMRWLRAHIRGLWRHIRRHAVARQLWRYLLLNMAFAQVELLYGFSSNSLGLVSDAAHMLFDCTALGIGLVATYLATLKPDRVFAFGFHRLETLAGFTNGVLLVFVSFSVLTESLARFAHPQHVHADALMPVAAAGLVVNLLGLYFFWGYHVHPAGDDCDHHHNMTGVYLHVLADTLGSIGVLLSSFLIRRYGWHWSDPACSVLISVLILTSAVPLLQESGRALLDAETLRKPFLAALQQGAECGTWPTVKVLYLRVWRVGHHRVALCAQLEIPADADEATLLRRLLVTLQGAYGGDAHLSLELIRMKAALDEHGAPADRPIVMNVRASHHCEHTFGDAK